MPRGNSQMRGSGSLREPMRDGEAFKGYLQGEDLTSPVGLRGRKEETLT